MHEDILKTVEKSGKKLPNWIGMHSDVNLQRNPFRQKILRFLSESQDGQNAYFRGHSGDFKSNVFHTVIRRVSENTLVRVIQPSKNRLGRSVELQKSLKIKFQNFVLAKS